jgi:Undecaprenyl-phosphate glucose phosphotransferase
MKYRYKLLHNRQFAATAAGTRIIYVRALLHEVLSERPMAALNPREDRAFGSVAALDPSDLRQESYWQHSFRRSFWLSPEIATAAAATMDFILVQVAAAAGFAAYSGLMDHEMGDPGRYVLAPLLAATLFVGGFERLGGYQLKRLSRLRWQLTRILVMWGVTVAVLLLVAFLGKMSESYSRAWALAWVVAAPAMLGAGRGILHLAMAPWVERGYLARNIVIVGAGSEGQRLLTKLQEAQDKSITICGVFDDRRARLPPTVCGVSVLGTTNDLLRFARCLPIDEAIIALPLDAEQRVKALFNKLKGIAIDVRLSIEPLVERFEVRGMSYLGGVPVLEIVDRPLKHWRAAAKWIEDKVFAGILLAFVSPLMALVALLIKLDSRGPVFFVQERFGFNNEAIPVLKFRTMYVDKGDQSGAERTVKDDPRVTRVGRVVRGLSIDELPQLINVLRGDMSLVGPRPHAIAMRAGDQLYCEAVEEYLHRHRVKPGITGWAQVNGLRGEVDTLQKARARVAHDLHYIEHWSPLLDIKILMRTFGILASRDNAY